MTATGAKSERPWAMAVFACVYVAVVLLVDTLAVHAVQAPFDWTFLRWRWGGFDVFKLVFWLVIPFALCVPRMDWGALGCTRWRRVDLLILLGLAVVGGVAVGCVALFPSLRETYGSMASAPPEAKTHFLLHQLAWVLSWLIGWEFLHRYFLLKPMEEVLPGWGWLIVPVSEGLYHLQKPLLEAGGMVLASLALTWWAMKRRNVTLPFLAHLIIELELIAFLLLV